MKFTFLLGPAYANTYHALPILMYNATLHTISTSIGNKMNLLLIQMYIAYDKLAYRFYLSFK